MLNAIVFSEIFLAGVKCPVCSKVILAEDIELHLVICLTKPRISYNGKFLITSHSFDLKRV